MRTLSAACLLAVLVGCTPGTTAQQPPHSADPSTTVASVPADDPYAGVARVLRRDGVEVWFEADLVEAWLDGPDAFGTAVARLGGLAATVEVAGFKVADEIGYDDGLETPEQGRRFLADVDAALAEVAPGVSILVDAVVPDLGCLPWAGAAQRACAADAAATYPAATFAAVTSYLRTGTIDRLDLSTGLLDEATYRDWGTSRVRAQLAAWRHVTNAGWGRLTVLQARKAMADAGGYQGSAADADRDLRLYVDLPTEAGARAVHIWTWRQSYDGQTVSLLNADLDANPLWAGLRERRAAGAQLFTNLTPSQLPADPAGIERECALVATVFDSVFVAAGTG